MKWRRETIWLVLEKSLFYSKHIWFLCLIQTCSAAVPTSGWKITNDSDKYWNRRGWRWFGAWLQIRWLRRIWVHFFKSGMNHCKTKGSSGGFPPWTPSKTRSSSCGVFTLNPFNTFSSCFQRMMQGHKNLGGDACVGALQREGLEENLLQVVIGETQQHQSETMHEAKGGGAAGWEVQTFWSFLLPFSFYI